MNFFLIFLLSFLFNGIYGCPGKYDGELLAVSLIFRHGDRTPNKFYPNDPYQNEAFWPAPPGQLTNIGKMQHFKLGQWFRKRYDGFLSSIYKKDEIYIRSSDGDRCLMSALADLAGLYPPCGEDIWNDNLAWQPIPVHTSPKKHDDITEIYNSCPKYNILLRKAEKELPYFRDLNEKNENLYSQLSKKSGKNISDIVQASDLFDTLHIEKIYNLTLPNWADELYPSLREIGDVVGKLLTATPDLKRLFMGRYFDNVLKQFEYRSSGTGPTAEKFRIFSAHDDQVYSLLNALNVQKLKVVPYAAVAILELMKSSKGEQFVQLFYKTKEDVADLITIPTCGDLCSYDKFVEIVQPIALSEQDYNSECQSGINKYITQ